MHLIEFWLVLFFYNSCFLTTIATKHRAIHAHTQTTFALFSQLFFFVLEASAVVKLLFTTTKNSDTATMNRVRVFVASGCNLIKKFPLFAHVPAALAKADA